MDYQLYPGGSVFRPINQLAVVQEEEMSIEQFERTLQPTEFYETFNGPTQIVMLGSDYDEPEVEAILTLAEGETFEVLESTQEYSAFAAGNFYCIVRNAQGEIIGRFEMFEEPAGHEEQQLEEFFDGTKDEFFEILQEQTGLDLRNAVLFSHA